MKTKLMASIVVSFALMLSACSGDGPALYTISGNVTDPNNGHAVALASVTVALEGDQTQTASTDANGFFSFSVPNGEYRLTPSLGSTVFDPLDNVLEVMDGHVSRIDFAVAPGMPTQDVNTWSQTGSMTYGRTGHTATLLADGRVLVAGGEGFSGTRASAEIYDPATGKWTTTGSMNYKRLDHAATRLTNGKVLVNGGTFDSNKVAFPELASSELFDPATGKWTQTGSMNFERSYHTSLLLANGKVLVTGALWSGGGAIAELYDPATGKWTATGSLNVGRYTHTATLLTDGRILVAGGRDSTANSNSRATAEIYDPVTGQWSTTGSMTYARKFHAATLLADGRVLAEGGQAITDSRSSAEIYDPNTGHWTTTSSLTNSRQSHSATLLSNHKVLVTGGQLPGDPSTTSTELYDPAIGTWSAPGNLKYSRAKHTATLLLDGKVLAAGGDTGRIRANAELFLPGN